MANKRVVLKPYKYCEACGKECVLEPRPDSFDKFTGKQHQWLICPDYKDSVGIKDKVRRIHSRWIWELVNAEKDCAGGCGCKYRSL